MSKYFYCPYVVGNVFAVCEKKRTIRKRTRSRTRRPFAVQTTLGSPVAVFDSETEAKEWIESQYGEYAVLPVKMLRSTMKNEVTIDDGASDGI